MFYFSLSNALCVFCFCFAALWLISLKLRFHLISSVRQLLWAKCSRPDIDIENLFTVEYKNISPVGPFLRQTYVKKKTKKKQTKKTDLSQCMQHKNQKKHHLQTS